MKTIVKRSGCQNTARGKLEDGTILGVTRDFVRGDRFTYSVNGKPMRSTGVHSSMTKYLTEFKTLITLTA